MAITDFNKKKNLDVESVTNTPTISHAVPIKITSDADNFESGSSQLGWESSSSFSIDANSEVYGTYSLQVNTSSESTSDVNALQQTITSDGKTIKGTIKIDSQSGNSNDFTEIKVDEGALAGDAVIIRLYFYQDGSIYFGSTDTGSTWSTGTVYDWEAVLDFTNDEVELKINGSSVGTYSFISSGSEAVRIGMSQDSSNAGTTFNSFHDNLTYTSDNQETGSGEVILDWANISSESDIGVYDENYNLLDYYIESFNATNETATIHVYRDWVQDGSTQAQVAYGNGPSDQSVSASTVFDKENTNSNLVSGYALNESSGDALDLTSNNNDGTVYGASQDVAGIVNGAYDFDGTDDYVEVPDSPQPLSFTITTWVYPTSFSSSYDFSHVYSFNNDPRAFYYSPGDEWIFQIAGNNLRADDSSPLNNWRFLVSKYDGSTATLEVYDSSGNLINSTSQSLTFSSYTSSTLYMYTVDGGSRFLGGQLDDFRFYGRALSSSEISAKLSVSKSSPDFFSQQAGEQAGTDLSGTVTLDGSGITANVYAYNETTGTFAGKTTAASNGSYTLSNVGGTGDIILIATDYDDGSGNFYGDGKSIELS